MLKEGQLFADEWNDRKDQIYEDMGDPICIITQFFEETLDNKGLFSPTIILDIYPKEEMEALGYTTFEQIADSFIVVQQQPMLRDFNVIRRHGPFQLSGVKFYEFDAEYMFEHTDLLHPLKVEVKILKAEHNGFYYDFGYYQSSAQNQTAEKEYEQFKASLKLI